MQRTISLRLLPDPTQDAILARTLALSAACFNAVAEYGWHEDMDAETGENTPFRLRNGVELHRATYYELRARFPEMPSQLVVSARVKATEALAAAMELERKRERDAARHQRLCHKHSRAQKPDLRLPKLAKAPTRPVMTRPAIRYDARSFRLLPNTSDGGHAAVSLASVDGRQIVALQRHPQAERWLKRSTGIDSADLVRRPSGLWLKVVLTIAPPQIKPNATGAVPVLGADLGINRPVVASDGSFIGPRHGGKGRWKEIEARYFRLKRALQAKGTKSAKRHLRKVRGRQQRFRLDCDRVAAKQLVQCVPEGGVLVIENLTDIRVRTRQKGRRQRRRHHTWSYDQIKGCIAAKAEERGVPVIAVNPLGTSRRCHVCGFEHPTNRRDQAHFVCGRCGRRIDADLNAARNIADLGVEAILGDGHTRQGAAMVVSYPAPWGNAPESGPPQPHVVMRRSPARHRGDVNRPKGRRQLPVPHVAGCGALHHASAASSVL